MLLGRIAQETSWIDGRSLIDPSMFIYSVGGCSEAVSRSVWSSQLRRSFFRFVRFDLHRSTGAQHGGRAQKSLLANGTDSAAVYEYTWTVVDGKDAAGILRASSDLVGTGINWVIMHQFPFRKVLCSCFWTF